MLVPIYRTHRIVRRQTARILGASTAAVGPSCHSLVSEARSSVRLATFSRQRQGKSIRPAMGLFADKTCCRLFSSSDSLAKATRAGPVLLIRHFLKPVLACVFAGQQVFFIEHVESFSSVAKGHEGTPGTVSAREELMCSQL